MAPRPTTLVLLFAGLSTLSYAAPAPGPFAIAVPAPPLITPPPTLVFRGPTKTWKYGKRNFLDDLSSSVNQVISELGSDIPSFVASGVPQFFNDLPNGDKVESSLGIDSDQLDAAPTEVLNIPPYANWTDKGWNVRFHGNVYVPVYRNRNGRSANAVQVYKQPNTSIDKLDELANVFLVDVDIQDLPESEQSQARNVTAEIFVVQQGDEKVTMQLSRAGKQGSSGESNGGGGANAGQGTENITLPYRTTPEGDFDVFLPIKNLSGGGISAGNATNTVQKLNVFAEGSTIGNATAYLLPPTGLTFISDIDDILRVTKIYKPKAGILNTFAKPFVPWMNMPQIYANWSQSLPNSTSFHYLTTTPEQATRNYMDFIYKTYPGGSFDTRPLNFTNAEETLKVRKVLLEKIFQTFPKRKFVLVADTSNSDVMKDYPLMATEFPGQVQCIFLRNTSATDTDDKFPYDTSGFKDLKNTTYFFFRVPDDLAGLDIENGQCVNSSIPQNVTFGEQDELLGIHGAASLPRISATVWAVAAIAAVFSLL